MTFDFERDSREINQSHRSMRAQIRPGGVFGAVLITCVKRGEDSCVKSALPLTVFRDTGQKHVRVRKESIKHRPLRTRAVDMWLKTMDVLCLFCWTWNVRLLLDFDVSSALFLMNLFALHMCIYVVFDFYVVEVFFIKSLLLFDMTDSFSFVLRR